MSSRDFKWLYKYLITITIPVSFPPSRFFLRSSARGHLVIPLTRRLLLWLNLGVSLLSNWNKLPHSFIHSFIPAISIAPLQVLYYSEALPTTARILYRSFTPKRTGNCR